LWARIPLKAWMSVCVYFVFVYVAALRRTDPPSKESYRLCIGLRNWSETKRFTDALYSKVGATGKTERERERKSVTSRPGCAVKLL
jgi:hypothetical protein